MSGTSLGKLVSTKTGGGRGQTMRVGKPGVDEERRTRLGREA